MLLAREKPTGLQILIIVLVLLFSSFVLPRSATGAKGDPAAKAYTHASLRAMARVYMASGKYAKAQPLLESALELATSTKAPDSDVCVCTLDLAYLYKNQGNLFKAEKMCLTGLELQEHIYGRKHPYVALTLRILSDIYKGHGRLQEATKSLERALTIMRAVENEDAPELAPFKVDMARLLVARGELAKAESYFDAGLAVIEESYGPEHLYTTKVLTSVAELYVLQGRYDRAEDLISKAVPIQEEIYGPNHHFLVPAWLAMARIHQARGDLPRAQALLAKSLHAAENQADSGRLLKVLEVQMQMARKSGDKTALAKLQGRIDKIRSTGQYASAAVASAIQ
jgi:tetratricopeptide (TPR) repeat protein